MSTMADLLAADRLQKRHTGHDWGPVNFDPLGRAYIVVAGIWTLLLAAGIAALCYHRHLMFIRMRNIALMIATLLMLHSYLVIILLNYPLNGSFPCVLGFWIMSVDFPVAIALFQAHNMQLLSLSVLQRQLILYPAIPKPRSSGLVSSTKRLKTRWLELSLLSRTYVCIAVGIAVQVRSRLDVAMEIMDTDHQLVDINCLDYFFGLAQVPPFWNYCRNRQCKFMSERLGMVSS